MKGDDIQERTLEFANHVLKMDRALSRNRQVNHRAMSQLVDAAMSIGRFAPLLQEANEIVAILTTIAKKTNPRN